MTSKPQFDIENLSIPAKAEAMRYGHTAVIDRDGLGEFLDSISNYLEDGEFMSVLPLSKIAGQSTLYSVRLAPLVRVKAQD